MRNQHRGDPTNRSRLVDNQARALLLLWLHGLFLWGSFGESEGGDILRGVSGPSVVVLGLFGWGLFEASEGDEGGDGPIYGSHFPSELLYLGELFRTDLGDGVERVREDDRRTPLVDLNPAVSELRIRESHAYLLARDNYPLAAEALPNRLWARKLAFSHKQTRNPAYLSSLIDDQARALLLLWLHGLFLWGSFGESEGGDILRGDRVRI